MRKIIFFIVSLFILGAFNFLIYQKEDIIKNGEIMLVELRPRDPRSLMQGDYMVLNYDITRHTKVEDTSLAIVLDANRVATPALTRSENMRRLKLSRGQLMPDSFFFQEGQAKAFEAARYAIFRLDKANNKVLIGLADKDRVQIKP
jgi:uncharacterized membrane-anchored protein